MNWDITLCLGMKVINDKLTDCRSRNSCKRFTTRGNLCNQSYTEPGPNFDGGLCDIYWIDEKVLDIIEDTVDNQVKE